MANALTPKIAASFKYNFVKSTSLLPDVSTDGTISFSKNMTNGTAADQADLLYHAAPSIAASGTLNLDLAGSVTDVFGATITFAKIKGVYIGFDSTNTGTSVTIGAGTNPALLFFADATDKINLTAGNVFLITKNEAAGWAVTASTADILKIVNNDATNAAVLNIAIWGTSV